MKFTYQGKRISLHGVKLEVTKCSAIGARKLKGLLMRGAITHCIQMKQLPLSARLDDCAAVIHSLTPDTFQHEEPAVQQLITQHMHLFQEPSSLPPAKEFDHSITLIPGAQPVNVRPYRYAPSQKSEIEK